MIPLEVICKWKVLVQERKERKPDYHPLGSPLFICLYSCDGQNKSCGGYIKYEKEENR